MDRESKERRGDLWYLQQRHIALALLGEKDSALEVLRNAVARGVAIGDSWFFFDIEAPAARLRDDRRFVELRATVLARVEAERELLSKLRAAGLIRRRP
jgi:hypothetical protein